MANLSPTKPRFDSSSIQCLKSLRLGWGKDKSLQPQVNGDKQDVS